MSYSTTNYFLSPYGLSLEQTSTINDYPVPDDETSILIKMSPLSPLAESSLFNINDSLTSLLPAFALDTVTDPEARELQIPDEIITLPYLSDHSLPLINDIYPHVVLPESEAKLNDHPLPLTYAPVHIVASSSLLTNDSLPTILSARSLLTDDKPNVKLNNYQSLPDDTSIFIIMGPPVSFSSDLTYYNRSCRSR